MRDLLNRISLRELHLVLSGLGAVITVAVVFGIIVPQAKALAVASQEVQILQEAAADGTELEQHLEAQHTRIEELQYRLNGDMANLPVEQVEAFIIGRLQRISWGNDVELVSVEPGTGDRVQIFQEILFNVQLSGQYRDLYRWLWDAREELGFVVVKEYSLSRHDDDDDAPILVAELSLASYRAIE